MSDDVEITRKVGNWTCQVTLKREVNRHRDRVTVDNVELHLNSEGKRRGPGELLGEARDVFHEAAKQAAHLAARDVGPNPHKGASDD